jgi:hypothetical protein
MPTILLFVTLIGLFQVDAAQPKRRYTWMGDGHSLWSWCEKSTQSQEKMSNEDRFRAHFCVGYVNGIIDMDKRFGQSRHFCRPPNMSMEETIREMVRDLEEHPDQLDRPAAVAAVESLGRSFPCR